MVMEYGNRDGRYDFIQNVQRATGRPYKDVNIALIKAEADVTSIYIDQVYERKMIGGIGGSLMAVLGTVMAADGVYSASHSPVAAIATLFGAGYVAFKGLCRVGAWIDQAEQRYQDVQSSYGRNTIDPEVQRQVQHQLRYG